MNIEQAIRAIAKGEPIYEDGYGLMNCIYCHGEGYPLGHDSDCPWLYIEKTVEENDRINALLNEAYPGLFPPK